MDLRSCHTFDPPPLLCVSPSHPHLLPPSRLSLDNGLLLTMSKLPRKVSPRSGTPQAPGVGPEPAGEEPPAPAPARTPRGAGRDPPTPGPRRAWPARPRCPRTVTWRAERRPGDSSKKLSAWRRRSPGAPLPPSQSLCHPRPHPGILRDPAPRPPALPSPDAPAARPGSRRAGRSPSGRRRRREGGGGGAGGGRGGGAGPRPDPSARSPPAPDAHFARHFPNSPLSSRRARRAPAPAAEGGSPASPGRRHRRRLGSFSLSPSFSPGLEPQSGPEKFGSGRFLPFFLLGLACLRLLHRGPSAMIGCFIDKSGSDGSSHGLGALLRQHAGSI